MVRIIMLAVAWLAFVLGCVGIFIPVLPTTPFILLAAFLFAKSSPRMNEWLKSTKVYAAYAQPFKDNGGLPRAKKLRMIGVSYSVLLLSAFLVRKPFVWGILAVMAAFLAYLMFVRISTVEEDAEKADGDQGQSQ